MPAPDAFEQIREDVEDRLGRYVIRPCERSGFKLIRRCKTGETHVGFFLTRSAAEDFLFGRLAFAKR